MTKSDEKWRKEAKKRRGKWLKVVKSGEKLGKSWKKLEKVEKSG